MKSKPSKSRSVLRLGWRGIRSFYYWPAAVIRHAAGLARHRADDWYRITAPWIVNGAYPVPDESKRGSRPPEWYRFRHRFTFGDEHVRFNLDYAMRAGDVKGLALIYAMGAGDYIFTTPLLQALRRRYPDLPIVAYATKNAGQVNSPLVGGLLSRDPNINEVRYFEGRQTRRYKNYDYDDGFRRTPPNYLAIPVFSEHLPRTRNRVLELFDTFGLPAPAIAPRPLLHLPPSPPPHVAELLEKIKRLCGERGARGAAFLQVDARSSGYTYPQADALAGGLMQRGYFVLSASKLSRAHEMAHELDFARFALTDSIHLLALLRAHFADMRIVSVASVFWSVSAGLDIPNLGMQHFSDDAMHNYWYPNITVITHRDYPRLPPAARFLAGESDYSLDARGLAVFSPGFVLRCLDYLKDPLGHGSSQKSLV